MSEKYLSINTAANSLGISEATVKNWIKHDFLTPVFENNNICFDATEVLKLKEKIEKGDIARLNKRANKRKVYKSFIPDEYVFNSKDIYKVETLINFLNKYDFCISEKLFLLSLSLLVKNNYLYINSLESIHDIRNYKIKQLYFEITAWFKEIGSIDNRLFKNILLFEMPVQEDILGVFYQSLLIGGDKAKKGSYYTPVKIIDEIINDYDFENKKVLDPCCGTGQFLLGFSNVIKDPNFIYGVDIDPIAVKIARINLIMKHENIDFIPKVSNKNILLDFNNDDDSLFDENDNFRNFDFICTNPPWGYHFNKAQSEQLNSIFKNICSNESFSFVLSKCIKLLDQNGILSFILPESILNVKVHADIRKIILENTDIIKIVYLERVFKNVFTPVIRLDLDKNKSRKFIEIVNDKNMYQIESKRFKKNKDFIFDIHLNEIENNIIDKVYKVPHKLLENNADWALGIVTGDNQKFILNSKKEGYEEIYKGSDVRKFKLLECKSFIKFEAKKFQQVAPEDKYREKEKLIYRFISKYLIFAYDNKQKLTLNSANILIPRLKEYSIKVISALFNSSLYQFIFIKKFSSIKVLRSHIEQLPLPILKNCQSKFIEEYVDEIIASDRNTDALDDYIFNLFNIDLKEQKQILNSI